MDVLWHIAFGSQPSFLLYMYAHYASKGAHSEYKLDYVHKEAALPLRI